MTHWFSLRRRLVLWLLGGIALGWLAITAAAYRDAHHEVDEMLDAQLVQVAQTLLALASEYDDDDDIAELAGNGHRYQKKFVFQLWDREGHLLLRSRHAPTALLTAQDGFSDSEGQASRRWRYYSQWDRTHTLRAIVGESHHGRDELLGHIVQRMLGLLLVGLPLLGTWVWFASRRGLATLDAVTAQVAARAPAHLDPIVPATAPQEIRPLLEALNGLLARVGQALESERQFTANAAHELRTPMAALATQAQVALRARDAAERDHALEQLATSALRARHLVDQLLTLARLDPPAAGGFRPVALDALVAEACAEHGALALEKGIDLTLEAEPATLSGNPAWLGILLRNLIDNALRYTPAGGKVGVGVTAGAGEVRLTVSDSGPGIPPQHRPAVLQRFHRLAGQEFEGSGLGLSIVARIVSLHGATMTLGDAPAGGLQVDIVFRA